MIQNLHTLVKVPGGFVITAIAFKQFLTHNELDKHIDSALATIDTNNLAQLLAVSKTIRDRILGGTFPTHIRDEITAKYAELCTLCGEEAIDVAVRSSGTAEDMPDASFAGQQDTFLNVRGIDATLDRIRACFASLYTDRAISYRKEMNYTENVSISVCIQKMVHSDRACSGVAFSIHPDSGYDNIICITGSYGLGELVVGGQVKPDEFLVFKPLLTTADYAPIVSKTLGNKTQKMII
jgi:pyruvate,water dikinase